MVYNQTMKNLSFVAVAALALAGCAPDPDPAVEAAFQANPTPWKDPEVNAINRLPARGISIPCESEELAIAVIKWEKPKSASRWVRTLDGEWDFSWKRSPERDWEKTAKIAVPSCWQLQGEYDPPLYTNSRYPIALTAPDPTGEPPKEFTSFDMRNPVGLYRTKFTLPRGWGSRRTVLHFDGVSSAFFVRVNGVRVGYSEDSRLPAEFDLSPYVKRFGENELEVEVYKHSDGSYLEDQDFWRFSGIFRGVYLVSEHPDAPFDLIVETTLSDDLKTGTLRVRDEKGNVLKERTVDNPMLWSPEYPSLYVTPLEFRHGWWIFGSTDYRTVSFGFRKVEIRDSVIYLNGKRALFKGANRHEMEAAGGYTVTRAEMTRDVDVLKDFNVNAVRTCHYPDDPDWYDLCDRRGLMLVCEANIESHGYGYGKESLAHRKDYLKAHVERGTRMVRTYRNHPSVVIWSMGNEAGFGDNFRAEFKAIRELDPTRPIQYERASEDWGNKWPYAETEVACPMYAPPSKCESYVKNAPAKPMVLCEYTHAMGNSNGGVSEYWDLARKYPSFQGGFVWDFMDQAVWKTDVRGKWLAYGGDFGDRPNDDNFNCNGFFDALRNPHPGAWEIKHAYQSVHVTAFDWSASIATVLNEWSFMALDEIDDACWTATDAEGNVLIAGHLEVDSIGPGERADFKIEGVPAEADAILFEFRIGGKVVAWNQFVKPFRPVDPKTLGAATPSAEPFRLNFWRAPTDNDRGWKMGEVCKVWKEATAAQKLPAGVKSDLRASRLADGSTLVDWTLVVPAGLPPIPRVGLTFTVPKPADGKVAYHGMGPWENYSDRATAAILGRHTATVGLVSGFADAKSGTIAYAADRLNPDNYIEPGEQGYRTGCRSLTVGGVSVKAVNAPFGFNVWPYPQTELEGKKHQWEIKAADACTVNVDAVQMGVGGDDSWGARPHAAYMPGEGVYKLVFVVKGLSN